MSKRLVEMPTRPWNLIRFPEIEIPRDTGRYVTFQGRDETSSRLARTVISILPEYFTTKEVLEKTYGADYLYQTKSMPHYQFGSWPAQSSLFQEELCLSYLCSS